MSRTRLLAGACDLGARLPGHESELLFDLLVGNCPRIAQVLEGLGISDELLTGSRQRQAISVSQLDGGVKWYHSVRGNVENAAATAAQGAKDGTGQVFHPQKLQHWIMARESDCHGSHDSPAEQRGRGQHRGWAKDGKWRGAVPTFLT